MNNKKHLFTSERLGFRNWLATDIDLYAELCADKEVMEYFPSTKTKKECKAQIERFKKHYNDYGYTFFAVDILESNQFIGFIGMINSSFKAIFTPCKEIGWRLHKQFWGFGYATEGAKRCLEYGFNDLDFKEIYAITPLKNSKSESVMIKIGMKKQGVFEHPSIEDGHWLKTELYYKIENGDS